MHRERKVDICCDGSKGKDDSTLRTPVLAVSLERMESESKDGGHLYLLPFSTVLD